MDIRFEKGQWETQFVHAYSYRFDDRPQFVQEDGYIRNGAKVAQPVSMDDYDYVTILSKAQYAPGTTLRLRCAFEALGAPLLVLTERLIEENGELRYGDHMEVVLYHRGVNVWKLWRKEDGKVTYHKRLGMAFPVTEGDVHELCVKITQNALRIAVDEMQAELYVPDLPERFHVGLSGCEGPNRFYSLAIEQEA